MDYLAYENYALAKGNIIRNSLAKLIGHRLENSDEEDLIEIKKILMPLGYNTFFEDEFGDLNMSDENVSLVVRVAAYNDYSSDFDKLEDIKDEFCLKYYRGLKFDESLDYLFNCLTSLDQPDYR